MMRKSTKLKGKINGSTIIVRDFNDPLPIMNKTNRQKINKKIKDLNNIIHYSDLTDIYKTLYPMIRIDIFSSSYGTFSRIDHTNVGKDVENLKHLCTVDKNVKCHWKMVW